MQISACTIVLLFVTYFSIIYLYTRLDQVLALNFGFKENRYCTDIESQDIFHIFTEFNDWQWHKEEVSKFQSLFV